MSKSADAFRTISEVADWLGVQPHVLRFWESKFTQVKPVKRAGGRRYYRPHDMMLLGGIRKLLHDDGLTIKGVQKIMREEGMAYVADLSPALDEELGVIDLGAPEPEPAAPTLDPDQPDMFAAPPPQDAPQDAAPLEHETPEPPATPDAAVSAEHMPDAPTSPEHAADVPETPGPTADAEAPPEHAADAATNPERAADEAPMMEDAPQQSASVTALPRFLHRPPAEQAWTEEAEPEQAEPKQAEPEQAERAQTGDTPAEAAQTPPAPPEDPAPPSADLPGFLTERAAPPTESDNAPPPPVAAPVPRVVDAPDPVEEALPVAPAALSAAIRTTRLSAQQRRAVLPLLARLAVHRDALAAGSTHAGPC